MNMQNLDTSTEQALQKELAVIRAEANVIEWQKAREKHFEPGCILSTPGTGVEFE